MARDRNPTLLIAHCEETPVVYSGEIGYAAAMPSDVELQGALRSLKDKVRGVSCETRLIHGLPWQGIVGLAEKEDASLIVMGTHGRTGVMRVLMGSVAEESRGNSHKQQGQSMLVNLVAAIIGAAATMRAIGFGYWLGTA